MPVESVGDGVSTVVMELQLLTGRSTEKPVSKCLRSMSASQHSSQTVKENMQMFMMSLILLNFMK